MCLATLAVFWPAREGRFVLIDDNLHLQENPLLNPPSWQKTKFFWTSPVLGLFVPVTYTGWAVQAHFARSADGKTLEPAVFHRVSLGLHVLNAALAFLLLLTLLGHRGWALAGAMAFSLHPLQTESVAWVSAQKDLFAGFFGLLGLWQYFVWAKGGHRFSYVVATVAFILSVLSKPSSVTLWIMAFALDVGVIGRDWKKSAKALLPWALFCLPILWMTKSLQPDAHIGHIPPWYLRPVIALDTLAFYVSKVVLPIGLAPDYSRSPQALLANAAAYYSWIIPVLSFVLLSRRVPKTPALALFFVAGVLPVLGFLPFYFQVFSTVADRYTYLSLIAWGLLLVQVARTYSSRATAAALVALLVIYGALSREQTKQWRTSWHLFTHTLLVNPGSLLAHNNLGTMLEERGRYDDAFYHYEQCTRIAPDTVPPWFNLARIHAMRGHFWKAKVLFEKVLQMNPDVPDAHYSLGVIARKEGQRKKAEYHLRRAVLLQPESKSARAQLEKLENEWKVERKNARAALDLSEFRP